MQLGEYTIDMIDLLEVSRYPQVGFNIQAYTGSPPYPSRQSVIKMATIYWGLWIECTMFHLLGMPQVSDWLAKWFSNLCLDLKELNTWSLGNYQTRVQCEQPKVSALDSATLSALQGKQRNGPRRLGKEVVSSNFKGESNGRDKDRFQEEIGSIPPGAIQMVDQLSNYIPDWMPRMPNKYDGFVFPWWLHGSSQYAQDFQKLRGGKIFGIADKYFQHAWPARHLSMGDQIDGWMEVKVDRFMKSLWEIMEQIEGKEGDVKHLLARWAALSRLVGMLDVA
ncbi:hypothetical protein EDD15DRAFT_2199082 [Pisolithus albus]|nr:hypothetical protein EDD15DRAFT_2199082 [Pisolithus albus]